MSLLVVDDGVEKTLFETGVAGKNGIMDCT